MSSLPNSILSLWLFSCFPFQCRHLFPQKASKLFHEHNICFLTHANDDVCGMVCYFQSDCSQLCKEYNIISAAASPLKLSWDSKCVLKSNKVIRFNLQVTPVQQGYSPCGGK